MNSKDIIKILEMNLSFSGTAEMQLVRIIADSKEIRKSRTD